ncbi:hypothetical protein VPH35_133247 [Triticum aestivum]
MPPSPHDLCVQRKRAPLPRCPICSLGSNSSRASARVPAPPPPARSSPPPGPTPAAAQLPPRPVCTSALCRSRGNWKPPPRPSAPAAHGASVPKLQIIQPSTPPRLR